jgi:hypothetical protein
MREVIVNWHRLAVIIVTVRQEGQNLGGSTSKANLEPRTRAEKKMPARSWLLAGIED